MTIRGKTMVCVAGLAMSSLAVAQNTPEIEPNESKALATSVLAPMSVGHTLTGNTTGTSTVAGATSLDTWRVRTALDLPAIYRYRLALTTVGTAGHVGTIRGLNQVAAAAGAWPGPVGTAGVTDTSIQTSSTVTTPARFNQWYGFGKGEELYYRVTGTTTTTADYVSTLERTTVIPTSLGSFTSGNPISISSVAQVPASGDTDFWVYDSNFNAISGYGNDDNSVVGGGTGLGLQGLLSRSYAAGTYYIAMTAFNLANNQGSPSDDNFRTGAMLDFPDAVAQSSATVGTVVNFTISDGVTTLPVLSTKAGAYDINWFSFTVPAPSSVALLGLGGLVMARRRRA